MLQACGLELSLLQPIIEQTAAKLRRMPPLEAQTGPALRHDESTLARHRQLLKDLPVTDGLLDIYNELADLIIKFKTDGQLQGKTA